MLRKGSAPVDGSRIDGSSALDSAPGVPSYLDAAALYRAAGWVGPLPLPPGQKNPPPTGWTGHGAPYPSAADSHEWAAMSKYASTRQTALRMADDVIGLDADQYGDKRGADVLTEAERRWGALPPAPRSTARGADNPGGIRFYRVPPGTRLQGALGFAELGLKGVEIIQQRHRFAVVWPSTNPHADDALYRWYSGSRVTDVPNVAGLPPLPQAWVEALSVEADRATNEAATDDAVTLFEQRYNRGHAPGALAGLLGTFERIVAEGCRHDAMQQVCCMAAREARHPDNPRYPAAEAREALLERFTVAMAQARPGERLQGPAESAAEFGSAWAWAIGQVGPMSDDDVRKAVKARHDDQPLAKGAKLRSNVYALPGPDQVDEHREGQQGAGAEAASDDDAPAGPLGWWTPRDLTDAVYGRKKRAQPTVGALRAGGVRFLYPGKEHSAFGSHSSGKSWFALANAAAEMERGNHVVYVHFEEEDETDTVQRLLLLGVEPDAILARFHFIGAVTPLTPATAGALRDRFHDAPPTLAVLDGQNEGMALHQHKIREEEGAAAFRQLVIRPWTAMGAAVLTLDHVVKGEARFDGTAIGSVHKGNALNGAGFLLENEEAFADGMCGRTRIYGTKDRPGMLRKHGQPVQGRPSNVFHYADMTIDSTVEDEAALTLWAPEVREDAVPGDAAATAEAKQAKVDEEVYAKVCEQLDKGIVVTTSMVTSTVPRARSAVLTALSRLVDAQRLDSIPSGRGRQFDRHSGSAS